MPLFSTLFSIADVGSLIYFLLDGLYAFPTALMASSWFSVWLLSMAQALFCVAAGFLGVSVGLYGVAAAHTFDPCSTPSDSYYTPSDSCSTLKDLSCVTEVHT